MINFGIKDLSSNKMIIPASSMRGVTRYTRNRSSDFTDNKEIQTKIFGKELIQRAQVMFSDLVATEDVEFVHLSSAGLNSVSNNLHISEYIPAGTEFIGKLITRGEVNGIERAFALSMVLDVSGIGGNIHKDFGICDVEILDRNRTIIFISYAWGDEDYMKWIYNLAVALSEKGIDIILDQISSSFDVNSPQEKINHWMTQAINNSDKIIAILTPKYCEKSKSGQGGVGYEYLQLMSETDKVSEKFQRYIGVFHSGDINCRPPQPPNLRNMPILDMSKEINNELLEKLVEAIKTKI